MNCYHYAAASLTPQRRAAEAARALGNQRRLLRCAREYLRTGGVARARECLDLWREQRELWRALINREVVR